MTAKKPTPRERSLERVLRAYLDAAGDQAGTDQCEACGSSSVCRLDCARVAAERVLYKRRPACSWCGAALNASHGWCEPCGRCVTAPDVATHCDQCDEPL